MACSEGGHPDSLKSFVIGSVIFIILVGLKPRSFSLVFPIVGKIQHGTETSGRQIPTDGDLDGQPQIGGGGGRTPAAQGRGLSRGRGQSGRGRAASGDRGSLREGRTGPIVSGARSSRHGTSSPTISAPPSTASLHHLAGPMRPWEPRSSASKAQWSSPQPPRSPFPSLPQEDTGRDEEARPILLDSPLLLSLSDFRARSDKASHNRKNEKGGPGTGPSKHTGGTRSFRTYEDILALDKDEYDEVTPNDVFLHVHTKDHDGVTFIDSRLAHFHAKLVRWCEEHTQATPDQPIDEEQLYYDAAGSAPKGRVYGLDHLLRRRGDMRDPGASTSPTRADGAAFEFDALVRGLRGLRLSCESIGNAHGLWCEHLSAPPPPPPQEHHRHVEHSYIVRSNSIHVHM
ncbi:hypothetical protein Scep_020226 [Stephania cephalantha]|uniref:Uncharacterized protein n=1 Tax=Stephania cephalantha TaxID=152367 RepID=A0AAP0ICK1_9MAGN